MKREGYCPQTSLFEAEGEQRGGHLARPCCAMRYAREAKGGGRRRSGGEISCVVNSVMVILLTLYFETCEHSLAATYV